MAGVLPDKELDGSPTSRKPRKTSVSIVNDVDIYIYIYIYNVVPHYCTLILTVAFYFRY